MKTIAIIGTSTNRSKFGNKAVRALYDYSRLGFEKHLAHVLAPCLMQSVPKCQPKDLFPNNPEEIDQRLNCQPKRMREIFTHQA